MIYFGICMAEIILITRRYNFRLFFRQKSGVIPRDYAAC
jgi:hypothetical protein